MIGIYFAVFQLVMKGEIGHAAVLRQAAAAKEEELKKQHGPKKGRSKGGKRQNSKHSKMFPRKGKAAAGDAPVAHMAEAGVSRHTAMSILKALARIWSSAW